MTGFDFDAPPSPGTNRHAAVTDCPTCGGDRLVPVPLDSADAYAQFGQEAYARCPDCNPAPAGTRKPVAEDAWWKK